MTNTEFEKLIRSTLDQCDLADLADFLGVSKPTIERWSRGQNLPCMSLRVPIVAAIGVFLL
jgi:transcriptional regulator with XRE-family HTH domain